MNAPHVRIDPPVFARNKREAQQQKAKKRVGRRGERGRAPLTDTIDEWAHCIVRSTPTAPTQSRSHHSSVESPKNNSQITVRFPRKSQKNRILLSSVVTEAQKATARSCLPNRNPPNPSSYRSLSYLCGIIPRTQMRIWGCSGARLLPFILATLLQHNIKQCQRHKTTIPLSAQPEAMNF